MTILSEMRTSLSHNMKYSRRSCNNNSHLLFENYLCLQMNGAVFYKLKLTDNIQSSICAHHISRAKKTQEDTSVVYT